MKVEDMVCSLEHAGRLKELGVKQESIFYWADGGIVISINLDLLLENNKTRTLSGTNNSWPDEDNFEVYSAFTASELFEILPTWACIKQDENKYYECGSLSWINKSEFEWNCLTGDKNISNSLAQLLIYSLENNLIKAEDLK